MSNAYIKRGRHKIKQGENMTLLQSIVSKPVVSRDTSKIVGRIKNAYLSDNFSNIVYFGISDCISGKERLMPFADVLDFADAVMVQNDVNFKYACDVDFTSLVPICISMPCYTQNGVLKGYLAQATFSQNGRISVFSTQTDKFSPSGISSVGDVIILKNGKARKAKSQNLPRPKTQTTVSILKEAKINREKNDILSAPIDKTPKNISDTNATATDSSQSVESVPFAYKSAETVILSSAPPAIAISPDAPKFTKDAFEKILGEPLHTDDEHTPSRVISDYSFLLGRTLSKDLTTFAGVLIAKKGEKITDSLVNLAMRHGKLVELALYSVNNEK